MKSKEEFIQRWQAHIAGLCLFGSWASVNETPLQRGMAAMKIPAEVQKLLGQLYDDLAPKPEPLPVKALQGEVNGNQHPQGPTGNARDAGTPGPTAIRQNGTGNRR